MPQYYIVLTGTLDGTGRSGVFNTPTADGSTDSYTFKICETGFTTARKKRCEYIDKNLTSQMKFKMPRLPVKVSRR